MKTWYLITMQSSKWLIHLMAFYIAHVSRFQNTKADALAALAATLALPIDTVGPKAHHSSFDDDQLMKLCLLMILCLISDRFIIKILVGA